MTAQLPKRMTFPSVPTCLVSYNSPLSLQTCAGILQQQKA